MAARAGRERHTSVATHRGAGEIEDLGTSARNAGAGRHWRSANHNRHGTRWRPRRCGIDRQSRNHIGCISRSGAIYGNCHGGYIPSLHVARASDFIRDLGIYTGNRELVHLQRHLLHVERWRE